MYIRGTPNSLHRYRITSASVIAFAIGLLSTTSVNIVGNLYLSEIIAMIGLVSASPMKMIRKFQPLGSIVLGFIIVLLGLVVADLVNETDIRTLMRGWANPIFAISTIIYLVYLFYRDNSAILHAIWGSALALLVVHDPYAGTDSVVATHNAFKVEYAPGLTFVILAISYFLGRVGKWPNIMLYGLVGIAFVLLGARSQGLFFMLSSAMLWLLRIRNKESRYIFICLLIAAAYTLYIAYVNYIMSTGQAGNSFSQLTRADNPYNPFELIKQGRTEFYVALSAIQESPLVGRGSWARDQLGYYSTLLADIRGMASVSHGRDFIAQHSVLLTSWLWGGALGLVGIVMVFVAPIRSAVNLVFNVKRWSPIIIFLVIQTTWHFLFSPFGHIRTSFPLFIGATLALSYSYSYGKTPSR